MYRCYLYSGIHSRYSIYVCLLQWHCDKDMYPNHFNHLRIQRIKLSTQKSLIQDRSLSFFFEKLILVKSVLDIQLSFLYIFPIPKRVLSAPGEA